eukprot:CAMPEP_0181375370 /NCGR_PEP_ID=MMETSP1106-20121128/16611_1 /TAXON_ID=81844 /ORGANISM="Mantoniella antarctica, Strain SL-175" /LENGTH=173 /DNA_ID=CAMNT_0023493601 /DNA_START=818 /DNA_END=1341 /DNA_ORIENTATION=-
MWLSAAPHMGSARSGTAAAGPLPTSAAASGSSAGADSGGTTASDTAPPGDAGGDFADNFADTRAVAAAEAGGGSFVFDDGWHCVRIDTAAPRPPSLFVGIYTRLTDRYEYLRRYRAHEERDVDIRRRTLMRTKVLLECSGGVRAGVIAEVVRLLNSLRSVTRVAILARLTGQQ